MKKIIYIVALFMTAGCLHTRFSPPSVWYPDSNSIGVRYYSSTGAAVNIDRSENAMKMMSGHCNGNIKSLTEVRITIGQL